MWLLVSIRSFCLLRRDPSICLSTYSSRMGKCSSPSYLCKGVAGRMGALLHSTHLHIYLEGGVWLGVLLHSLCLGEDKGGRCIHPPFLTQKERMGMHPSIQEKYIHELPLPPPTPPSK